MRPLLLIPVVGAIATALPHSAAAQQTATTTTPGTAKLLQADYAVPDAPALKMLDADDSKLLRPVSVRSLTATVSSATGEFSFIPRALGIEFSPVMLVNGEHVTLDEYQKRKMLYRLRVSIATKRDTGTAARTRIAGALRLSLQDNSDLRTNTAVVNSILALTTASVDSAERVKDLYVKAHIPRTGPRNEAETKVAAEIQKQVAAEFAAEAKRLTLAAKRAQEDAKWNKDVFDVALGTSASSADSTGKGVRSDGVALWLTKGWGFHRAAQLFIGTRASYERSLADTASDDLKGSADGVLRLYVGSNQYKALIEFQATGRESSQPQWVGNAGGELQLAGTIWVNATAGYQATGDIGKGRFISSLKLKFTPPNM